ncbi:hypothetical protein VP01_1765g4 [Puccinia sorghi]|uniref:Uncharacterized protein n=1 Tax=Puccinia sorghi TaxID=27349 RepID=A0A0L6VEW6_9BASI|nr:hypothetical protein VP01_1765g4 [Puccinia sorghi]
MCTHCLARYKWTHWYLTRQFVHVSFVFGLTQTRYWSKEWIDEGKIIWVMVIYFLITSDLGIGSGIEGIVFKWMIWDERCPDVLKLLEEKSKREVTFLTTIIPVSIDNLCCAEAEDNPPVGETPGKSWRGLQDHNIARETAMMKSDIRLLNFIDSCMIVMLFGNSKNGQNWWLFFQISLSKILMLQLFVNYYAMFFSIKPVFVPKKFYILGECLNNLSFSFFQIGLNWGDSPCFFGLATPKLHPILGNTRFDSGTPLFLVYPVVHSVFFFSLLSEVNMTQIISPLSSLRYVVHSFLYVLNDVISSTHLYSPSTLSIFSPCSSSPVSQGYLPVSQCLTIWKSLSMNATGVYEIPIWRVLACN